MRYVALCMLGIFLFTLYGSRRAPANSVASWFEPFVCALARTETTSWSVPWTVRLPSAMHSQQGWQQHPESVPYPEWQQSWNQRDTWSDSSEQAATITRLQAELGAQRRQTDEAFRRLETLLTRINDLQRQVDVLKIEKANCNAFQNFEKCIMENFERRDQLALGVRRDLGELRRSSKHDDVASAAGSGCSVADSAAGSAKGTHTGSVSTAAPSTSAASSTMAPSSTGAPSPGRCRVLCHRCLKRHQAHHHCKGWHSPWGAPSVRTWPLAHSRRSGQRRSGVQPLLHGRPGRAPRRARHHARQRRRLRMSRMMRTAIRRTTFRPPLVCTNVPVRAWSRGTTRSSSTITSTRTRSAPFDSDLRGDLQKSGPGILVVRGPTGLAR